MTLLLKARQSTRPCAAPRHLPPGDRFAMVRDLISGNFLAHQRNVVLVGGTGTGKSHLAIAIARACIRDGARGRFFNVVDLVNRP
jgi:DNA replication protein DnaC